MARVFINFSATIHDRYCRSVCTGCTSTVPVSGGSQKHYRPVAACAAALFCNSKQSWTQGLSDMQSVQTRLKRQAGLLARLLLVHSQYCIDFLFWQGNACSLHGTKQPFRAIQEPQLVQLPMISTFAPPRISASRLQQTRRVSTTRAKVKFCSLLEAWIAYSLCPLQAAEAMDMQVLHQKLQKVHSTYNTNVGIRQYLPMLYSCKRMLHAAHAVAHISLTYE